MIEQIVANGGSTLTTFSQLRISLISIIRKEHNLMVLVETSSTEVSGFSWNTATVGAEGLADRDRKASAIEAAPRIAS
jgi:hypothetical protein